jgi:HEPN domain-containing protein
LPRKTDSANPGDWIAIAEADLALVRLGTANETSFGPCRAKLAEAFEKVLKAELISLGWPLEKLHDLQRLANLLCDWGSDSVNAARPLANSLSEAYFSYRYPGFDLEDADWPTLRQQLDVVAKLLGKVKERVAHK